MKKQKFIYYPTLMLKNQTTKDDLTLAQRTAKIACDVDLLTLLCFKLNLFLRTLEPNRCLTKFSNYETVQLK